MGGKIFASYFSFDCLSSRLISFDQFPGLGSYFIHVEGCELRIGGH